MGKYLFVYYGGMMAPTPAEQKKTMDTWMAWFGKLGPAIVDAGAPTKPGKIVGKSGAKAISDTPISGYTIIKADNLDAAIGMAKSQPDVSKGLQIAIYELMPM